MILGEHVAPIVLCLLTLLSVADVRAQSQAASISGGSAADTITVSVPARATAMPSNCGSVIEKSRTTMDRAGDSDDVSAEWYPMVARSIQVQHPPFASRAMQMAQVHLRAPLKIAIWGDSHMASGAFRDALVGALSQAGYEVEPSTLPSVFLQTSLPLPMIGACSRPGDWVISPAYLAKHTMVVGPSLTSLRSTHNGSAVLFNLRDRQGVRTRRLVRLFYTPHGKDGALIRLSIDGGPPIYRLLARERLGGARIASLVIKSDAPLASLQVEALDDLLELQGVSLDAGSPQAVTLDVYGLNSSTAQGWALADTDALRDLLATIKYDIVVMAYGTNEAADNRFDAARYRIDLQRALEHFRQVFPDQECFLIGPPDRGVRQIDHAPSLLGDLLFYSKRHQQVSDIQSQVSAQFGCGFWNWQEAMGGMGASYQWDRAALMAADLTHLTANGYAVAGHAFAQSLGWVQPRRFPLGGALSKRFNAAASGDSATQRAADDRSFMRAHQ